MLYLIKKQTDINNTSSAFKQRPLECDEYFDVFLQYPCLNEIKNETFKIDGNKTLGGVYNLIVFIKKKEEQDYSAFRYEGVLSINRRTHQTTDMPNMVQINIQEDTIENLSELVDEIQVLLQHMESAEA